MVVDTRHKWDVLISYSWMDVIPTHNGRFYWRPRKMGKINLLTFDLGFIRDL